MMANLSEDIQCAGSDTRPPMLDRTDFASWQQRIRLYCQGKENGVNILKSINEGPFQMGTFRETLAEGTEGAPHLAPERPRVYSNLSPKDKERYNANIRATNILLHGLPKDIYSFINHYTDAKDILDNVKMLLEGSELTKEDRELQLFVTAVKLNRGLRDSNYDQLYAYLKQHEAHANKNKMMLDQFTQHTVDPLALMSNVSHQQHYSQSSTTLPSTYVPPHFAVNTQLDSGLSSTDNLIKNLTNTLALLTQSYKMYLPQTNNQLRTSSNPRNQATVHDGRVVVQNIQGRQNRGQRNNARGAGAAGYGGAQNRVGNVNPGQARQENGVALDEEQLLFIAGGLDKAIDEDVDEQPIQDLALNVDNVFQADDCNAFDSDVDEAPTVQTMFMANLSSVDPVYDEVGPSYDSDIISEVHDHDHYQDAVYEHHQEHEMHDDYVKDNAVPVVQSNVSYVPNDAYMMIYNDMHEPHVQSVSETTRNTVVDNSLTAELATYKEQVELYERWARFELTEREQKIDEQLRIVITDHNIKKEKLKKELHSVKLQLASTINHSKSMVEEVTCSKNITGDRSRLKNFGKKFIGTVRFGNDRFGAIMGYGDYVIGDRVISRVYYVEGLGHNMFSVGQFCDSDLEVAFRKHLCYVRDTDGVELIKRSRGSNLYNISVEDMIKSFPIFLLSKASKNKSWLWHRRLNHLNFRTINDLARKDLVRGLPRLKFEKDHMCSAYLTAYYERVGIFHQKTVPRTPQQNGVVERQNRTLVEAARTMLIFSKAPMFLWAEAVATACYTQNRSLIHTLHNKTPYELVHDKKPDLTFFRVFGALCYPTNDSEDLGKLQPTADIGIFVGYAPSRKGYRIYNKRTRRIMETIHVQFDELTEQMAPVQLSTGPAPTFLTPGQISSGLVPNPVPAAPYVPPTNKELEILFQPMFDEYMEPPRVERPVSPAPAVSVPVNSAGTPSSTTIDQDAPSPSHSPSSSALQSPSLHQGIAS
ncbi:retrovirus-related pol polyprotein from transposon TNT 1-94 [Tanacetum coccineum]